MDAIKRTVLFVSYAFPPLGAAGSLRPLRFAKYLPQSGWEPLILTIKERPDNVYQDYSLLDELPDGIRIIRTSIFDPFLLWERGGVAARRTASNIQSQIRPKAESYRPTFFYKYAKILDNLVRQILSTPDHQVSWVPFAVLRSIRLFRNQKIDLVLTTSPPHSAHFVGLILKGIYKVPWIADFRDPWMERLDLKEVVFPFTHRIERVCERCVISAADKVIVNTDTNRDSILLRYASQNPDKFVTVHNGYDAAANIGTGTTYTKFTITHTGTFYPKPEQFFFFCAFERWLKTLEPAARANIQILFVGDDNEVIRKLIDTLGLSDVFLFLPRVDHPKALEITCASDLLLVCLGIDEKNAGWVPIKIYDYLLCNRPILGLLPEGEAARIIRDTRAGYVVTNENYAEVGRILDVEYGKWLRGIRGMPEQDWASDSRRIYSAEFLTSKLAHVMESALRGTSCR
jgi:glycosyltransferase involved in cell wall biosynthesis